MAAASGAIEFEPDVMMDLSELEFESLPVVLAALIGRGNQDNDSIRHFLTTRDCPYEWDIIEFVLDHFEGKNLKFCLWSVDKAGNYSLILKQWSKYD
ncbi:hypothetical protein [Sphingopyxis sp. RIFCSPHIGHO2_12_FULL_65_19]|uniref:hypothetical protein n=1 Tax=Sphingopyxis sp. RIFCSPHIGHO2_12_FULL_65_19 TaxID=1802172 RepID=UPI0025F67708|nr:hypothetical protein [Sphingopyxis sp. RIFCSPHIGHO2_12_FULL_65_19]